MTALLLVKIAKNLLIGLKMFCYNLKMMSIFLTPTGKISCKMKNRLSMMSIKLKSIIEWEKPISSSKIFSKPMNGYRNLETLKELKTACNN